MDTVTEQPLQEFKPSGNPAKTHVGIGMPATLYLQQFGDLLFAAFGAVPYQVGSSLLGGAWRDVDVRVILDPEVYTAMGFGDPTWPHENPRWCAYCAAFSELGRRMTGLPIDFQIQDRDQANKEYPMKNGERRNHRSALCVGIMRRQNLEKEKDALDG
jgi:hypothetical protein